MTVEIHYLHSSPSSSKYPKFTSQLNMMVLKVVVVLMAVASYVSVANGKCCGGCPLSGSCSDNTGCTPWINCCATGSCNWFCCNCGGVCRRSLLQNLLSEAKIEADNLEEAVKRFNHFDTDKNGAIDFNEMKQVNRGPAYVGEAAFQSVDVNKDGRVTIEEFDEDAGRALQEKIRQELAN